MRFFAWLQRRIGPNNLPGCARSYQPMSRCLLRMEALEDLCTPSYVPITEFTAGITSGANLAGIAAGPDGNLWFTEYDGDRIGRITPSGVVTEFSTGISTFGGPDGITAGPDGNLWFTEFNGNRIGRITTSGTVTEFGTGITSAGGTHELLKDLLLLMGSDP